MAKFSVIWKRTAKIIVILYMVVICFPAFLFVLVRTPLVQQMIVKKTTAFLSEELNTDISIGSVTFGFFLDVVINDLHVNDQHNQELARIEKLSVGFKHVSLRNRRLSFGKAEIRRPVFHLKQYEGEEVTNLQFIIDYFSSEKQDTIQKEAWKISFNTVKLKDAEFSYSNDHKTTVNGDQIDFNHLHLTNINLTASDLLISDTIQAIIHNLSFEEQSGFIIKNFKSDVAFCNHYLEATKMILSSQGTRLNADLCMEYSHTRDFNDFVNKVNLKTDFRKSLVDFKDIRFFAEEIPALKTKLFLSGKIDGTISNLSSKNLNVETGRSTRLNMNCLITGLPEINETFFDLNISQLATNSGDIIRFLKDLNIQPNSLKEISTLANFDISGSFIGFLNSFFADFKMNSNIGEISGKMSFRDPDGIKPSYNGNLQTKLFDIGKLFQNDMIGIISSDLEVNGEGSNPDNMRILANGQISELELNNYIYNNIAINADVNKGLFDGDFNVNDPNIFFDFNGQILLNSEIPEFSFVASAKNANLNALNFNRNDSLAIMNGNIEFNGFGSSIDMFYGKAALTDIRYQEGERTYYIDLIEIEQDSLPEQRKRLGIHSDLADGYIEGIYNFSEFPVVLNRFIADYISVPEDSGKYENHEISDFNVRFDVTIKNFEPLSALFITDLKVSENTHFSGTYNSKTNALFSSVSSQMIEYTGISLMKSDFDIETFSKTIYLTVNSDRISYSDSLFIENFIGNAVVYKDNMNFSLFWDNKVISSVTSGDIKGNVVFSDTTGLKVELAPSNFTLANKQWQIFEGNSFQMGDSSIVVNNLHFSRGDQEILIHGAASRSESEQLRLTFTNFDLDNLETVLSQFDLNLKGNLDGFVEVRNLFSNFYFTSDLLIENFRFEDKNYGDIKIMSQYNYITKSIYADVRAQYQTTTRVYEPLLISGNYYFDRPQNELDFKCKLSAFELNLIEPFLADQLRFVEGKTSGEIFVKGDIKNPDVNGSFWFLRTIAHVNYLNTIFILKDTIHVTSNSIYSNNFLISDGRGKNANADIMIRHNNFSDFDLDIKLQTQEDFVFMNTGPADNDDFYGTIVADGFVHVTGKPDDVIMNVSAQTARGTQFFLPMDAAGSVYESNFITFINPADSSESELSVFEGKDSPGFRMNLDLQVTPDAEMQIIFDPKIGDIMRGKATGNLRIDFDINGDFIMFGDIELIDGDYLFTLENVINKRFFIYPGGNIKWEGDPYNAIVDINTYYPLRARLFDLVSHIDSSEIYRKKIPVNLELELKNNLMTPDITFNISLPQSDETTRNIMNTAISSDQELNRQVFSLLILNSFVQPEASFSAPLTQGMGTTSLEFVSNQFSNWLSQISRDFDIGINYRPGSELSTDEIEVMVSTQLLNDRIRIEGNVGVGGNQVGVDNTSNQQVMGDVSIENLLTPDGRIRMRAFNRSNPIDAISQNSPYTQGVGIFFRKDFDTFRDLLKKRQTKQKSDKTDK